VNPRTLSLIAALLACALVVAQFVYAGAAVFHTWQYATALAILAWMLIAQGVREMRESGGGRLMAVALLGVVIVVADGMASGLLGPDTERVTRAPGSILPVPGLGAAVFSSADPQTIASGSASITLRRRDRSEIAITPGSRKFFGALMLFVEPIPAAYVEAFDASGNHLTITQPNGGSFLSPVLLFQEKQAIAGQQHPVDGFAIPAAKRTLKVVYLTAGDVARLHVPLAPGAAPRPAILYDVFDLSGNHSLAIGVAQSGDETTLASVRLRSTLGHYPELVIASVPEPYVLLLGLLLFASGIGALALGKKSIPSRAASGAAAKERATS
jgi:hypothetical protein